MLQINKYQLTTIAWGIILLLPFFLSCIYIYPSADDFFHAYKIRSLGLWEAQASWYNEWTGRFFSTFILSLHPLVVKSYLLYKLIALALLILTLYSIYAFLHACLPKLNNNQTLFLSIVICYIYLNGMPELAQGIYWEPGSITYQLPNALILFFISNAIHYLRSPNRSSLKTILIQTFFVIAICGSNETAMIFLNLIIVFMLLYAFLLNKDKAHLFLLFFGVSLVCSMIVYCAPGNYIRQLEYKNENIHDLFFSLQSATKVTLDRLLEWAQSVFSLFFGAMLYLFFFTPEYNYEPKKRMLLFSGLTFLTSILGIFIVYFFGFWNTGETMLPDRALNVAFWVFVISFPLGVYFIFQYVFYFFQKRNKIETNIIAKRITTVFVFMVCIFYTKNNWHLVVKDIFSGDSIKYQKEFNARDLEIINCKKDTCEAISFLHKPRSIFNDDITENIHSWPNFTYASFYNKPYCKLKYSTPEKYVKDFLFSFEDEGNNDLKNTKSITSELSFSSPNSSIVKGENSYSCMFEKTIRDITGERLGNISGVDVHIQYLSKDSATKAVLVFNILDGESKKSLLWKGTDLPQSEDWQKVNMRIEINNKVLVRNDNIINVYVWIPKNGTAYMDNMNIKVF